MAVSKKPTGKATKKNDTGAYRDTLPGEYSKALHDAKANRFAETKVARAGKNAAKRGANSASAKAAATKRDTSAGRSALQDRRTQTARKMSKYGNKGGSTNSAYWESQMPK